MRVERGGAAGGRRGGGCWLWRRTWWRPWGGSWRPPWSAWPPSQVPATPDRASWRAGNALPTLPAVDVKQLRPPSVLAACSHENVGSWEVRPHMSTETKGNGTVRQKRSAISSGSVRPHMSTETEGNGTVKHE